MRLIIALLLPWLTFFTIGRPFAGITALSYKLRLSDGFRQHFGRFMRYLNTKRIKKLKKR